MNSQRPWTLVNLRAMLPVIFKPDPRNAISCAKEELAVHSELEESPNVLGILLFLKLVLAELRAISWQLEDGRWGEQRSQS